MPEALRPHFEATLARRFARGRATTHAELAQQILDHVERAFEGCGLGAVPWTLVYQTIKSDPEWSDLRAKEARGLREDAASSRRLDETTFTRRVSSALPRDLSTLTASRALDIAFEILHCEWDHDTVLMPRSVHVQLQADTVTAMRVAAKSAAPVAERAEPLLTALIASVRRASHPDLRDEIEKHRAQLLRVTIKNLKAGGGVYRSGIYTGNYVDDVVHACNIHLVPDDLYRELSHANDGKTTVATAYAIDRHFEVGAVIEHPTLGRGNVSEVADDRITVVFADRTRVLRHARWKSRE